MPIKRFGSMLISRDQFGDYMTLLKNAYHRENLANVMCRDLVSVDWRGYVYDCDFNQMLEMPLGATGRSRTHLRDLLQQDLTDVPISVADHCYGCTAGQGSSCCGALNEVPRKPEHAEFEMATGARSAGRPGISTPKGSFDAPVATTHTR